MPDNLWPILGVGALVIAAVFAVFVPRATEVNALQGLTFVIVRWFHSGIWLLLALSFFLRMVDNESLSGLANPIAGLAGIGYLIYIVTMTNAFKS
ncbi:MAG: hypothetical protein GC179_30350 [Anaerolineaceae bacterium]|nr:hypothetical protein [Anaerolineaceae bacterium]